MSVEDRVQKTKKIVVASVSGLFVAWMAMVFALRQMWAGSDGTAFTPLAAATRTALAADMLTPTSTAPVTPAATRTVVREVTAQMLTPSNASAGEQSPGDDRQGEGGQLIYPPRSVQ